jgi:N-acetylglucosamine-6-sulfatase
MKEKNGLMGRRGILVLVAAAALHLPAVASASTVSAAQAGAVPPNIVLVLTDDLDLELGSLAYMPNLQQLLIDQGASFENSIVPLSLCCPSRSTILTGQYTHNHQVYTNSAPNGGYQKFFNSGLEATTLATALQGAGYQTVLLGKYLNGYPLQADPLHVPVGWSEWYSPMSGNAYAGLDYTMNENGTPVYYGTLPEDYLTDVISAKADDFIVRAAAAGDPFFVYLAPYNPHQPATPPVRFQNLFPGVQAPRTPSFNEADVSDKPQFIRDLPLLTDSQIADLDDLYRHRLQCMQAVDELIANLVATLDATHQLANTYIVFTSDNGYHEGQHRLKDGKYTAYEPDLRVPLIVRGPGVGAAVSLVSLASEVDLAPTFAELAQATLPLPTDGRSLVPLFGAPPPTDWRQIHLFEEYPTGTSDEWKMDGTLEPPDGGEQPTAGLRFTGLRTASYKYVEYDTGEREYYDLVADPDELQNLYSSLNVGLREQLAQTLAGLSGCAADSCRAADSIPLLAPAPAATDAHVGLGTASNLNRVLEPGETVVVEPSWRNTGTVSYPISGVATDFSGPAGAVYTLVDPSADYGMVAAGATAGCHDSTGDCYEFGVSAPEVRPALHWDATYVETLASGATRTWALHIGNSFSDVPNSDPYYPSIETVLHNGVTSGCAEGVYCPEASVTRAEMAVFLLKSSLGAGYTPPPATGIFQDVPADDPFAPWIEDLFHRGITAGCGENFYCPNDPVTRATMAALLLKTLLGPAYTPPPATGIFDDVPAEDPFAPWIEDLYARGITAGCQVEPPLYCPDAPNTRQEMAVFLVKTFSLTTDEPVPPPF